MTSGAPWSVKGIDPKAREVAKDLARRSGMTLGEWLNRMILEDDQPEDVFSESQLPERPARSYFETPRGDAPARYEAPVHPGDEVGRMAGALDRLSQRIEASEARTGMAISSVEQSVRDALERIAAAERDQVAVAARFEGVAEEIAHGQNRLADRFRRLEEEAAGPRSAEALRSLEQALGTVANNLYDGEARTREMLAAVEARVGKIEAEGAPASATSPEIAAEAVVERVSERLMQAEARTGEALASLQQSFAALDGRLQTVERSPGASDLDRKLEDLAAELTRRVEASRAEMAAQLAAASEGRFDRMERKLGEMSEHVRAAEQRSAQAIEQMGQEVRSVADTLGRRVQASEHRSAEAIEQVGGEMARIAQAVETRLARTDTAHVEALEKLGGEIARITERLAERMANAERRSAQALDDINEQVSRVSERIHQRQERASDDLVERIRLSEERTARLLEEAREKIDQRLAETQNRLAEAAPPRAFSPQDAGAFGPIGFAPAAGFPKLGPAEPDTAAPAVVSAPIAAPATSAFAEAFPAAAFPAQAEPARPSFDASDFEAADDFAADDDFKPAEAFRPAEPFAPAPQPDPVLERALDPEPVGESLRPSPTAEEFDAEFKGEDTETAADDLAALEAVQAEPEVEPEAPAVQPDAEPQIAAAVEPEPEPQREPAIGFTFDGPAGRASDPDFDPEPAAADLNAELAAAWAAPDDDAPAEPGRPLTTREVIEQARAAARAAAHNGGKHKADKETKTGGMFSGFGLRPRRRAGSTLNTALLVAGLAAGLTVAVTGFVISEGDPSGATPDRIADARDRALADQAGEITAAEADTTPPGAAPRAAVALAPQAIGPSAGGASAEAAATYERALQGLASGSPSGLDDLKTAANLGYPPAQFHLGKLYQEGKSGVPKDLVEARRWTERAALGGDRTAMHNFALNNYFGEGGPKDEKAAADWFRRAAELGLVDSQYNLGRLYEDGQGVSKNPAEAYKWYLIAARAGDAGAQASLARVKAQLSPEARNVAERAAAGFTPALPTRGGLAAGQPPAPSPSVAMAQRVLARLSYYSGPVDGSPSPALRGALSAYQRDRGLAPTGTLDQATLEQLSVYTR